MDVLDKPFSRNDYQNKTQDELIADIEEFYHVIHELDEENQSLHKELEAASRGGGGGKKGRGGGRDVDDALQIAELQHELEGLLNEKERSAAEILSLQEKVSESLAVQKTLQQQKLEAEAQAKDYLKRIQSMEAEMEKVSRMSRAVEQQSKEANKQKTAGVKETQRLFDENDQLRDEVCASEQL
jgi:chromosome segregation ATPase